MLDIRDGLSNTVAVSERMIANVFESSDVFGVALRHPKHRGRCFRTAVVRYACDRSIVMGECL